MSNPSTQGSKADTLPGSPPSRVFRSHPGSPYSVPQKCCLELAALGSFGQRTMSFLVLLCSLDSPGLSGRCGVSAPAMPQP